MIKSKIKHEIETETDYLFPIIVFIIFNGGIGGVSFFLLSNFYQHYSHLPSKVSIAIVLTIMWCIVIGILNFKLWFNDMYEPIRKEIVVHKINR